MAWTSEDLIADVRRDAALPDANTLTPGTLDTDILLHADKAMQADVVPVVMRAHEEFFVTQTVMPFIQGAPAYRLPTRAIGGRVRDVGVVNLNSGAVQQLTRMDPVDAKAYAKTQQGLPFAYYLEAGNIVLVPPPAATSSYALLVKYFARPGRMATVAGGPSFFGTINTISDVGGGVADAAYSGGIHSNISFYDIISQGSPFNYVAVGAQCTNLGADSDIGIPYVALGLTLNQTLQAGDLIAVPDHSNVVQLPVELHPLLTARTVIRVLQSLGKQSEAMQVMASAQTMQAEALTLITPRVDGSAKKIVGGLFWRNGRNPGSWWPR